MKKIITFFILLITLISCNNISDEFKFMRDLKIAISKKYAPEEIQIYTNNKSELIVIMTDDKFLDYSSNEKQIIANAIGEIAGGIKKSSGKIRKGNVKFVSMDKLGVLERSESESFEMKFY